MVSLTGRKKAKVQGEVELGKGHRLSLKFNLSRARGLTLELTDVMSKTMERGCCARVILRLNVI